MGHGKRACTNYYQIKFTGNSLGDMHVHITCRLLGVKENEKLNPPRTDFIHCAILKVEPGTNLTARNKTRT